jgi:hypothetical protein
MSGAAADDLHCQVSLPCVILGKVVGWLLIGYAVCLLPGLHFQL